MNRQPIFFLLTAVATLAIVGQQAIAAGYIHFDPQSGATVAAGKPVIVNGTSAPSNSTRTNCVASLNVNLAGYGPVKAMGPNGFNDYTIWTAVTPPMLPGHNELEAQLLCHTPNGIGVSYIKHLVHNVTGITTGTPGPPPKASTATGATTPLAPKVGK